MGKVEFERFLQENPQLGRQTSVGNPGNGGGGGNHEGRSMYSSQGGDEGRSWDRPPYTHYNETTGVPLTADAATAHIATGQTVTTLEDAYGKRLARLSSLAASSLAPRREHLSGLRHLILQRSEEIEQTSSAIRKETQADAEGVLERLSSAESLKQAALQQQVNEVSAELEAVDRLVDKIAAGSEAAASAANLSAYKRWGQQGRGEGGGSLGMIGFVQVYPELSSAIDRVAGRYVNSNVGEVSDDLPRECAERNEVVRKCDKYEQALAVKDQMLWNLLKDKEGWDEKLEEERAINKEYTAEMAEWLTLTNNMSVEINRLRDEHSQEKELIERENAKLRKELDAVKERMSVLDVGDNY